MGHGKETPRQKMIGLMYLFLTALMALNVSKDVLNSFVQVSDSLEQTISNYKSKNEKVYNEFAKQMSVNEEKVKPWNDKALIVKNEAEKVFKLLEDHKFKLLDYAEGEDTEAIVDGKVKPSMIKAKDNIDQGGEYFIGLEGGKNGKEIKAAMNNYLEKLLSVIPEEQELLRTAVEATLKTEDHPGKEGEADEPWASHTFAHIPLIADFVALTTLQTNIKNTETDVINYLISQITAGDFAVNKIEATVIAKSNYVMKGSEYEAKVFIAAYDSTKNPEILVGDYKHLGGNNYEMIGEPTPLEIENGKGKYSVKTSSTGNKILKGLIKIVSLDEQVSYFPFETEYTVAVPNVVVSPTKMNVFYYGIDNPVDISAPGVASKDLVPSASGASLRKARGGGYIVKPKKTSGKVYITVFAKTGDSKKNMGKREFRIKTLPKPTATVMGKEGGKISKALITNANGVIASLGKDFVFDLKFRVTKFTVTANVGGFSKEVTVKGNQFNKKQKDMIKSMKAGTNLIIENIEAIGPDGRTQALSPIVFKIK